ncbi:site-specific integrase [soil metagenome]
MSGSGSVIRKPGRKTWNVVVDLERDPATGKRKQQWHSGFKTKREAERALREIMGRLERKEYVAPSKLTVEMFLTDEWLPAIRSRVRASTLSLYTMNVSKYAVPRLGSKLLQQLTPADLNAFYASLLERGARDRPLSPSTVRNVHVTLRRALVDAQRWGHVTRNVASLADPPRVARTHMKTWSPEELRAFLEHARDERLYAGYVLLATTGMRRGEALGLRWGSLDLSSARLSVSTSLVVVDDGVVFQEPKTATGRRSVPIPPSTVAALKAHRKAQLAERMMLGPDYSDDDLFFCREDGSPAHPTTFSRRFDDLVAAAGLRRIRLHDLRHTFATLALQANVPVKVVSEILGHASVTLTYDTYSHVIPGMAEDATSKVAALVFPEPI